MYALMMVDVRHQLERHILKWQLSIGEGNVHSGACIVECRLRYVHIAAYRVVRAHWGVQSEMYVHNNFL